MPISTSGAVSMLWPLALYFAAIIAIIGAILVSSFIIGERRKSRTPFVYESGMNPTGTTHLRLSVSYYLIAMFFLIFDIEAAFIFAWAVSVREAGWGGYAAMAVFVAILTAGLVFLWREGALDLKTRPRKMPEEHGGPAAWK